MSDLNLGLMVGEALASDRAVRRTAPIDVVKSTRQVRIQVWLWVAVVGRGRRRLMETESRMRQSAGLSLMNTTSHRQVPVESGRGSFACGVRPYSPGEIDELADVARSG